MTIVFPPSLTPSQATWELTHNVAGGSNAWGQVQRISRGSPVWSCSISMPTLAGEDIAIWEAFEAQAARGDVRFYMPHPVPLRGSFDNSELLVNGDFTQGATGWTAGGGNLLTYSEQFDNAAWSKSGVTVTANATNAPDGAMTADLLEKVAQTFRYAAQPATVVNATTYRVSAYFKAGTLTHGSIRVIAGASDARITVDLSTGTVSGQSGTPGNIEVVDAGSGWYRTSFTFVPDGTSATVYVYPGNLNEAIAGDVYAWGAQLSRGSALHPYASTTSSARDSAEVHVSSRVARVRNAGTIAGYIYQPVSLTADQPVALVVDTTGGNVIKAKASIISGAGEVLASGTCDAPDRIVVSATPAVTGTYYVTLQVNTATNFDSVYFRAASLSRCLLVRGGGQSGSSLIADGALPSQRGLLEEGDMFTVYVDGVPHLARIARPVETNSSGVTSVGSFQFEPALPGSPADNAPIILRNPFCRMYIPSHNAASMYKPPMHGSFAFEALEDPTRP